jgi:DNA mismatch repair protein MutS2
MDEEILDEAVRLVDRKERAVEQLMEDLQETRRRLDEDARRIAALLAEAESAARMQKALAARQAETEKETRQTARKKITDELLKARAEVQAVLNELKTEKKLVKAREAKERLAAIEAAMQSQLARTSDYRPVAELRAGDRVEVTNLGAVGVLLENPAGRKRVRIRMGEKEVSVSVSVLAGLAEGGEETESQATRVKPTVGARRAVPLQIQEASTVLDVRGQTAEEAREAVVASLDRAALDGIPVVRIIHGHGTGRLKQVLREYLKDSPYVAGFRPGERSEGGDGVTVVTLR